MIVRIKCIGTPLQDKGIIIINGIFILKLFLLLRIVLAFSRFFFLYLLMRYFHFNDNTSWVLSLSKIPCLIACRMSNFSQCLFISSYCIHSYYFSILILLCFIFEQNTFVSFCIFFCYIIIFVFSVKKNEFFWIEQLFRFFLDVPLLLIKILLVNLDLF